MKKEAGEPLEEDAEIWEKVLEMVYDGRSTPGVLSWGSSTGS